MGIIRDTKPYRILSLDGGGTWALIQAMVLMDIYGADTKGHEILADFDMVAANSGGGIVAAGLIANMTPSDILSVFFNEQKRKSIFQELPFYKKNLLRLFGVGPQFSTEGKRNGLSQVLSGIATNALQAIRIPNRKGKDIRFMFSAYDYDRDRAVFFRSDPNSPAANFPPSSSTISVIDVVHASSTALVQFFDKPALLRRKLQGQISFFWANFSFNPDWL
jgi:patatin-like phospholipase/acyl hydrolase